MILFIDLTKAFDRAVRKFAFGWPLLGDVDNSAMLTKLGCDSSAIPDIIAGIDEELPILRKKDVHEHVVRMLKSLHSGALFRFGNSTQCLLSTRGGRQACRFGGVILNIIYNGVLSKIKEILDSHSILVNFA